MSKQAESKSYDVLRRDAKRLLRDYRKGLSSAINRVSVYWPSASSDFPLKLTQVQLVVARERGFRSWRHLRASVHATSKGGPVMNVKTVVKEMEKLGAPQKTIHVLTNRRAQADAIFAESVARWGDSVVSRVRDDDRIPESRVVVGSSSDFCFSYMRQALLGGDAESNQQEMDKLMASASALVADIPTKERMPCIISGKEGKETVELASITFSQLISKYGKHVEVTTKN